MIALLSGCIGAVNGGSDAPPPWADEVREAPGADGNAFHDPSLAANGARGAGCCAGGVDVFSIADHLELGWRGRRVVDGPGPDLVVFENAFQIDDARRFMDPCVVSVSADGVAWEAFPHDFQGDPADPTRPEDWTGFAGITPTLLHVEDNPVDAFDAAVAGGDAFDLWDLPDGPVRDLALAEGIVGVRILSAEAEFPRDPAATGPDIDAVYAREWVELGGA